MKIKRGYLDTSCIALWRPNTSFRFVNVASWSSVADFMLPNDDDFRPWLGSWLGRPSRISHFYTKVFTKVGDERFRCEISRRMPNYYVSIRNPASLMVR